MFEFNTLGKAEYKTTITFKNKTKTFLISHHITKTLA